MNQQDRTEILALIEVVTEQGKLLARVDERTINTYKLVEKQNGRVLSNTKSIFYGKGAVAIIFILASLGVALAAVG